MRFKKYFSSLESCLVNNYSHYCLSGQSQAVTTHFLKFWYIPGNKAIVRDYRKCLYILAQMRTAGTF